MIGCICPCYKKDNSAETANNALPQNQPGDTPGAPEDSHVYFAGAPENSHIYVGGVPGGSQGNVTGVPQNIRDDCGHPSDMLPCNNTSTGISHM